MGPPPVKPSVIVDQKIHLEVSLDHYHSIRSLRLTIGVHSLYVPGCISRSGVIDTVSVFLCSEIFSSF